MRLSILFAVAILPACTEPASNDAAVQNAADPAAPVPGENVAMSEPIRQEPGETAANRTQPLPEEDADQCGASEYQYLVGRDRSEIPEQPAGANWRITCTGCPITMDYSPARMNIFYDEETEIVEEVRCG